MSTGASLNRHRSKQDYETPADFIVAVKRRWQLPPCGFNFDLAASDTNSKGILFYDEAANSLEQDWTALSGTLWLNPPFNDVGTWARKCRDSTRERHYFDRILFLVPASVGSEWFTKYVDREALVLALVGRLSFDGQNPFPKDCILAVYGERPGFEPWRWK